MTNHCENGDDCPWLRVTEEKIKSNTAQFNLFKWVVYVALGIILSLSGYDTIKQEKYIQELEKLACETRHLSDKVDKLLDTSSRTASFWATEL